MAAKSALSRSKTDYIIKVSNKFRQPLTTVAYCVYDFLKYYPDYSVFATGNTLSRTRLYRMAITNNLKFFPSGFNLFGLKKTRWLPFKKEMDYEAFLVTKKSLNLNNEEG